MECLRQKCQNENRIRAEIIQEIAGELGQVPDRLIEERIKKAIAEPLNL